MAVRGEVLDAYGDWIAGLASWTHFVTLTHDPRRLESPDGTHTRVGLQRHRRLRKLWVLDHVRRLDSGARWWSETELHLSGQPHEHGLLAASVNAPVYSMAEEWFKLGGAWRIEPIESVRAVAAYVAKYGEKATAWEPMLAGFGLNRAPSFSMTWRSYR
jgi:hypothetical protein